MEAVRMKVGRAAWALGGPEPGDGWTRAKARRCRTATAARRAQRGRGPGPLASLERALQGPERGRAGSSPPQGRPEGLTRGGRGRDGEGEVRGWARGGPAQGLRAAVEKPPGRGSTGRSAQSAQGRRTRPGP